jgi:hypothetical protein
MGAKVTVNGTLQGAWGWYGTGWYGTDGWLVPDSLGDIMLALSAETDPFFEVDVHGDVQSKP